jgi:hypothetical protein
VYLFKNDKGSNFDAYRLVKTSGLHENEIELHKITEKEIT